VSNESYGLELQGAENSASSADNRVSATPSAAATDCCSDSAAVSVGGNGDAVKSNPYEIASQPTPGGQYATLWDATSPQNKLSPGPASDAQSFPNGAGSN